ncbi:MAG TPA: SUMF1/EgtB/PvdO family nonheme iron enzyme, partial [Kofleriaceae bacterium]
VGALIVGLALHARARRELDALVAAQTRDAAVAQDEARRTAVQRDVARKHAFELFDTQRWPEGETAWAEVDAMASREERAYRAVTGYLDSALLLDPSRPGLRSWAADVAFERLVRAERDRRSDLVDELASRLFSYHDRRRAELRAAAHLEIAAPSGTSVSIERQGAPAQTLGPAPLGALTLPPGSLVLVFEAPGRVTARLPVLLVRGETLKVNVDLPTLASAPPGMLYVPAGRFLFGSAVGSDLRHGFFDTAPLHEVSTAAYFIGRYEVTFGEWIEFLDDLPPVERFRRRPSSGSVETALTLTEIAPRRWRLTLTPTQHTYVADTGQKLHYERRAKRADQDWTKFPVTAVSYPDAVAYAAWLARTGRVPGARVCDEYEWERAARGADARTFPSGETLGPDDANIDVTYGREPVAFGPDEVGSHPASRSPVGADDMAGNVWEFARSVELADASIARGGAWYLSELNARSMNRTPTEPTLRHPFIGVRLCATPR